MSEKLARGGAMAPAGLVGVVVGVALVGIGTAAMIPFRGSMSRAVPALVFVVPVVAAALLGQRLAAVVTAVGATAMFSYAFVPPYDRASVSQPEDVAALVVFLVVALVVGSLMSLEASRRRVAEERSAEIRRLFDRNEELVAERERLQEEANRVLVIARVADQRSALLRSVSHDLRTPLGTIQAVASDLRDGADYPVATRERLLDLVADEAARLDRIVGNLLSMSRIEAGSFEPDRQAIAIDELLADRVAHLDRILGGRVVEVHASADLPLVQADYSQLDQVLTNLLENIGRHTPPGSSVCITAAARDGMMHVTVADKGSGIPAGERDIVFEPFRRGSGAHSTGLGLAICKAIVEANGGEIGIDDTATGTTVHFTVPLTTDLTAEGDADDV